MTATLEDVDLSAMWAGPTCDSTINGVVCGRPAKWIGTLHPCGCIRFACDPCKKRRDADKARDAHMLAAGTIECVLCERRVRDLTWSNL